VLSRQQEMCLSNRDESAAARFSSDRESFVNIDILDGRTINSGLDRAELPPSQGAKGSSRDGPERRAIVPMRWREEFVSLNSASLTLRLVFPLVASATLLPFVSPGIALLVGVVIALTLGNPFPLTTTRFITPLLQMSVIGLGAGMNLIEVGRVGMHGFLYTFVGITLAMSVGLTFGWLIRAERDTSLLITVGTAICGGSAIAAVAPAIRAKNDDVSLALATVFFLNAVALLVFPPIGHHLGLGQMQFRGVERPRDSRHEFRGRRGDAIWRPRVGNRDHYQANASSLDRARHPGDWDCTESRKCCDGCEQAQAAMVYSGIPWRGGVGDLGSGFHAIGSCRLPLRAAFTGCYPVFNWFRT